MSKCAFVRSSIITGLVLCLTGVLAVEGSTYYIAPGGNDLNSGTSGKPWATLAYGASQLQPGDMLIIRNGQYVFKDYGSDRILPKSGSPNAWITIKGDDGAKPVLIGINDLANAIDLSNVLT